MREEVDIIQSVGRCERCDHISSHANIASLDLY